MHESRPWTVYALIAFGFAGLVWSLFTNTDWDVWFFVNLAISAGWSYALWIGKGWAFSISFMCASLCAVALVGIAIIQGLLLEMAVPTSVWWGLLVSSIWLFLLRQPETKRFAGFGERRSIEGDHATP